MACGSGGLALAIIAISALFVFCEDGSHDFPLKADPDLISPSCALRNASANDGVYNCTAGSNCMETTFSGGQVCVHQFWRRMSATLPQCAHIMASGCQACCNTLVSSYDAVGFVEWTQHNASEFRTCRCVYKPRIVPYAGSRCADCGGFDFSVLGRVVLIVLFNVVLFCCFCTPKT